jgi:hypothetical protein
MTGGYTPAATPVMGRKWRDLPLDLIYDIDAELTYIEKVRVRATCVWWNSALPKMPNHKLPQLPWLLQTNVDKDGSKSHSLFNLRENKNYQLDLPHLEGKLFKGSSYGWLATISVNQDENIPSSPDICLLNPLTGAQIQLPPRSTFPDVIHYISDRIDEEYRVPFKCPEGFADYNSNHVHLSLTFRIVTSSSCAENCVVVAIYGEQFRLAWCMPGHKQWTPLDLYLNSNLARSRIDDVLFSNNKLYVIDCHGRLFQVENIGPNPKVTEIITRWLPDEQRCYQKTIVECSDGRLMMVVIRTCDLPGNFEASELDVPNKCWRLVNNIGNDMLFLGYNHSFSLSSDQFPGYRGNRIYFTDDPLDFIYREGKRGDAKIGIYNFDDGTLERLPGFPTVRRSLWPQAVWVTPPYYS